MSLGVVKAPCSLIRVHIQRKWLAVGFLEVSAVARVEATSVVAYLRLARLLHNTGKFEVQMEVCPVCKNGGFLLPDSSPI